MLKDYVNFDYVNLHDWFYVLEGQYTSSRYDWFYAQMLKDYVN